MKAINFYRLAVYDVTKLAGFIQNFFMGGGGGGGNFFILPGNRLIEHSEGERVGGGCVLSNAVHSAEAYCLIPFLTVRFTLWITKGNAFTGTAKYLMGENNFWGGGGGGGGGGSSGKRGCSRAQKTRPEVTSYGHLKRELIDNFIA